MPEASETVVVVGSINQDIAVLVDAHPRPGETVLATGRRSAFGGKGANQAVAAARSGAAVHFIGAVGDDDAGTAARGNLERAGIDVAGIATHTEQPTGTAYITVAADGENSIVVVAGANAALTAADVDAHAELLQSAGAVVIQLEIPADAVERAVLLGGRVVLNAAPARPLAAAVLAQVDVLVVNEGEGRALTGTDATGNDQDVDDLAAALLDLGPRAVVITLGARGAAWRTPEASGQVPAAEVAAVDTTGAGDAFVGAFAAAFVRNGDVAAATRAGVELAGRTVGVHGAQLPADQL